MKLSKHAGCLVPLIAFLVGLSPILVEHFRLETIRAWNQAPNHSGRLLRLFAKEYEDKHGRKPTIEEFRKYSIQRFREEVDTFRVDPDFRVRCGSEIPPVPTITGPEPTVPEPKAQPSAK